VKKNTKRPNERVAALRASLDALMDDVRDCLTELEQVNADSETGTDEMADAAYGTVVEITTRALKAVAAHDAPLASLKPQLDQIFSVAVAFRIGRATGYAEGERDGVKITLEREAARARVVSGN
jgi:hypothetical protein